MSLIKTELVKKNDIVGFTFSEDNFILNSLLVFTNSKIYDIIHMPNKLNIQLTGVFSFLKILIPFCDYTFYRDEFDKMQIPYTMKSIIIYPICI